MTTKTMTASGEAKILKTQRRVLDALTVLTSANPPAKLTVTEVCRTAGITPDALALSHHAELKSRVETAITQHNATHFGKRQRKNIPASDVAMARIERLESELAELRARYASSVLSVRSLALALEKALTELNEARRQKASGPALELLVSPKR
jgi:hypothetical protein